MSSPSKSNATITPPTVLSEASKEWGFINTLNHDIRYLIYGFVAKSETKMIIDIGSPKHSSPAPLTALLRSNKFLREEIFEWQSHNTSWLQRSGNHIHQILTSENTDYHFHYPGFIDAPARFGYEECSAETLKVARSWHDFLYRNTTPHSIEKLTVHFQLTSTSWIPLNSALFTLTPGKSVIPGSAPFLKSLKALDVILHLEAGVYLSDLKVKCHDEMEGSITDLTEQEWTSSRQTDWTLTWAQITGYIGKDDHGVVRGCNCSDGLFCQSLMRVLRPVGGVANSEADRTACCFTIPALTLTAVRADQQLPRWCSFFSCFAWPWVIWLLCAYALILVFSVIWLRLCL